MIDEEQIFQGFKAASWHICDVMAARQQSRNYFEALARSSSDVESSSDDKAPAESMRKTQHSARCGMHCGRPMRVLRLVDT